jgi:hypothetical protein
MSSSAICCVGTRRGSRNLDALAPRHPQNPLRSSIMRRVQDN